VTYGFPAIITRSSNNYGPFQFPEKVIPLFIANAVENKHLPLYGDGLQVRDWIYVKDNCRAIVKVLLKGNPGEVYNIGAGNEITNIELARIILDILGKPVSLIKHVTDRPGHDRRYALETSKVRSEIGWKPELPFREGIERTVKWYMDNRQWLDEVRSGEYRRYYEKWYSDR
jgi:dTDP-glucose 4,6-dehydratase